MGIDTLSGIFVAQEWLSLREVLRLLLLSLLLSLWCCVAFPRNASSRRVLLLMGIVSMALLPWLLRSLDLRWQLPVDIMPAIHLGLKVPNLLVCLWLLAAAFLSGRYLRHVYLEIRQVSMLPELQDPVLAREIGQLHKALLPNYPDMPMPDIRLGPHACACTLAGAQLMLPPNWSEFSATTRRSILAHELIHIARRDDLWLLILRVLLLSYWWMPWLKKLEQLYVESMEESCDDAASELIGEQHSYVYALYEVAVNNPAKQQRDAMTQRSAHMLVHMQGHHLTARVARFGQRRRLELDTAGVFWTLMLMTISVTWISGVQPVLTGTRVAAASSTVFYQLPAPEPLALSTYPLITEQLRVSQGGQPYARRLQDPMELSSAVYPGRALAAGREHEVTIRFAVADDGSVVQPHALKEDKFGFAHSALRAVRASRYQPLHKITDIKRNPVAIRRARDARSVTFSPHETAVRYERKFIFRIDRRP
ncbi:MAG: M56 family metallopeptidase [bacterium]